MVRPQFLALLAVLSLLWSGASSHPSGPPGSYPSATVGTSTQAASPRLSLAQLQQRLIDYAGTLADPADVTLEGFSSVVRTALVTRQQASGFYEARRQVLLDGHMFYAALARASSPSEVPLHEVLFFLPGGQSFNEATSPPCPWNADHVSRRLEMMGYARGGEHPFQRGWRRQHWKPLGKDKGLGVSLLLYRTHQGNAPQTCVYGIRYWGGDA